MYALISPDQIELPPGAVVRLPASWADYQTLAQQRGDRALPRLKYRPGELLLMSPLPKHGRDANTVADVVKVLLERGDRDYSAFTPITLDLPEISGIEPDYCFYIENWAAVAGKDRLDWQRDPPPDLVIEIDVTSYSDPRDYRPYRVPEIWLLRQDDLQIYQLAGEDYRQQTRSRYFPEHDLPTLVSGCLAIARQQNSSAAIRDLRDRL
ncbi:MAG: Uma2 family endonuclease [Spirulinaceae cyanobacterium SM2_1_0]|nr:Uma2 family endonuclease [Spirulinaceae cyanobacterium SM2_1_0]